MDIFKCLDCGDRMEKAPDDEADPTCPACGSYNMVQVFGELAQTDGPV